MTFVAFMSFIHLFLWLAPTAFHDLCTKICTVILCLL